VFFHISEGSIALTPQWRGYTAIKIASILMKTILRLINYPYTVIGRSFVANN
jgi:hypothetical protein